MIDGVEILSATAQTSWHAWTFIVALVVTMVIAMCVLFLTDDGVYGISAGFIVFIICALVFGVGGVGKYETDEYYYKVTIDDSVSMNQFLDKYEILDQEGKIYTVREKTND